MTDYCSEVEVSQHSASRPPPIALGINVEKPKFPEYAVYSKRLESFKEWPEHIPIDKKDLVEAGLVYTGVGDSVRCYFCGGGLRNWEQGDVPMEEHAKWYTNCPHVMFVNRKAYVERQVARGKNPEDLDKSSQQDKVDAVDFTKSVAAQSCIEKGYSEQMVRKAIYIFMERSGNKEFNAAELGQILFDIENNPEKFNERSVCTEDVKHAADEQETPSVEEEKYTERKQTMSDYNSEVAVTQHYASRPPPIAPGNNEEKPKFPHYSVYSKRLESFKTWPKYYPIDKKDLAEAGLVYTGVGDSVACYFCGGELRNWKQCDVPMEEHAKWYNNCPHIMLVKGKAYVERLARGEKPEGPEKGSQQDKVGAVDYTSSVAAQSCIDMGYPEQMVRKAIDIFMERNGSKDFKGADLCEILFDIEENPKRLDGRSICIKDVKNAADEQDTPSDGDEQHGVGDSVRNYLCGGELRNWEQGDVTKEEYAKRHTNCPQIILVKGQDNVERLARGEKTEDAGTSSQQDNVDAVDYMTSVAAQSCIEMGYSEQTVRKAKENNPEKFEERRICTEGVKHAAHEQETPSVGEEQHEPLETLQEENDRLVENQMCKMFPCNVM